MLHRIGFDIAFFGHLTAQQAGNIRMLYKGRTGIKCFYRFAFCITENKALYISLVMFDLFDNRFINTNAVLFQFYALPLIEC